MKRKILNEKPSRQALRIREIISQGLCPYCGKKDGKRNPLYLKWDGTYASRCLDCLKKLKAMRDAKRQSAQ